MEIPPLAKSTGSKKKPISSLHEERTFFEGPHSRLEEFIFIIKVLFGFIKGIRALHFMGPYATVFGSARYQEGHPAYSQTRKLGAELAKLGFTVLTGGGPGLMEAANRGAKDVGGKSVGCNIMLTHEKCQNNYLDKWVFIRYFFMRKVLLVKYSYAFVVMPGGFGTLDEFFEALTLIQTLAIKKFPVVLMDKIFYKQLCEHFELMAEKGTIDKMDMNLFLYTDSVDEAIKYIEKNAILQFNLHKRKKIKPMLLLGEKR